MPLARVAMQVQHLRSGRLLEQLAELNHVGHALRKLFPTQHILVRVAQIEAAQPL